MTNGDYYTQKTVTVEWNNSNQNHKKITTNLKLLKYNIALKDFAFVGRSINDLILYTNSTKLF